MKWSRVVLTAIVVAGAASCSSPTLPRLPQPETPKDPPPDSPGVVSFQNVDQAGQARIRLA